MPNYTYRCKAGHEGDLIRPVAVESVACGGCQRQAYRVSVYRQAEIKPGLKLPGKDFMEASEMLASQREEFQQREGVEVPPPPLWQMAKQRLHGRT